MIHSSRLRLAAPPPGTIGPVLWGLGALAGLAAAIYLITAHWVDLADALSYLLIPAVMLLCMFGHGGHGGQAGDWAGSAGTGDRQDHRHGG